MRHRSTVTLVLFVLVTAGSGLTVSADPWKDESGHGGRRHHRYREKDHKHKNHKHKHHKHEDEHATEHHVIIVPPKPPPSDPHIGFSVETGDVSVGGRIRLKD